ncbi:glycoside hydrolase family 43 protein [Sandarakinorhabdus sp. DWP1-3-1]|uniref:glycoside hydrolase family 43 protein n=1 Tax=Sandarakinorhabdus sp. DWP1-3-1 TaxID=2804627 RepID=UPI003CF02E0B
MDEGTPVVVERLVFFALLAAAVAAPAPVIRADFPDPFLLAVGSRTLAFATNHGDTNVQVAISADLKDWRRLPDALPTLPKWARRGFTWAPEVIAVADGYVLYFTARDAASGLQCIGAATARDPRGPYAPHGAAPLVCDTARGGSIDPSPFRDADGRLYLYVKNDGNHPRFNLPTEIIAQPLTADGLALTGAPVALVRNDAAWEGRVVEAPTMIRHDDAYVLLFSANDYGWPRGAALSPYAIGWAPCAGPMGPCRDAPANPLLASRDAAAGCLSGPGHAAVLQRPGGDVIAFHAWSATARCRPDREARFLHVWPLRWNGDVPVVDAK